MLYPKIGHQAEYYHQQGDGMTLDNQNNKIGFDQ